MDLWGPRIFVDVVFGVFFKRSAQKVENGIEAPQPEISLEGYSPPTCPGRMSKDTSLSCPSSVSSINLSPFVG